MWYCPKNKKNAILNFEENLNQELFSILNDSNKGQRVKDNERKAGDEGALKPVFAFFFWFPLKQLEWLHWTKTVLRIKIQH